MAFKLVLGFLAGLPLVVGLLTAVLASVAGWKWIGLAALTLRAQQARQGWAPGEGPGTEQMNNDHGLDISLESAHPLGQFLATLSQIEGCEGHLARHRERHYQVTLSEGAELMAVSNTARCSLRAWQKHQEDENREALVKATEAIGLCLDRLDRGGRSHSLEA